MSTNFYAIKLCAHCGHEEEIHIGKYSNKGFSTNLKNLNEDVKRLVGTGYTIKNEYRESYTLDQFESYIEGATIRVVDYEFC